MSATQMHEKESQTSGLECPLCGCPESRVVWVRKRTLKVNGKEVGSNVRARECDNCAYRFQTSEKIREE